MTKLTTTTPAALIVTFSADIGGETVHACDARELHAFLQNGDKFADWIKARIEHGGFSANQDFVLVSRTNETKDLISGNTEIKTGRGGDRRSVNYTISLDMAKHLGMMERNAQGKAIRDYFIAIEREARKQHLELPVFITPAQQRQLQDAIAARFPDGRQRPYAWSRFNAHYKLGSYKQLPADQCDEALAYIAAMDGGSAPATSTEADMQQQLQTARFVLSFDANGRMQLQEIAADAIVTTSADMAKLIEQPGGPIRRNQITDIIQAAAKRLK